MERRSATRALLWSGVAVALLLPALVLPPVPIDETRYLAVAWNMHLRGDWLVPWLDGAPYPDKPPLLFWLINLAWDIAGVHAWSARVLEVLLGLATLPLLRRLALALGADAAAAGLAAWLWLGCLGFAGFAGALMFDVLLCACTLLAWLGTAWLVCGRRGPGAGLLGLGLGLGILAKGPVSLLVGGLPALLAPWWAPAARRSPGRHYLATTVALAGAALLALAWAIPAARRGGPAYGDAIFLTQTAGRVAESFAHDRGPAWYLPIVPLLLLPWTVGLGRGARRPAPAYDRLDRFALAASVPAFLAFCLISGKQPHYLLPLLPALAPAAAARLADGRWRVVGWRVGVPLVAIALAFLLALLRLVPQAPAWAYAGLVGAVLPGLPLLMHRTQPVGVPVAAVATLLVAALAKLALVQGLGPSYSVERAATRIAAAQRAGIPLLQAGRQNGLYTFAGRLTAAIPTAENAAQVAAWARAHPDGWVISNYQDFDYPAPPLYRQPFMGRHLTIWRAGDIAGQAPAAHEAPSARLR
ncbi:ArnT family glycosyltransferase [Fulvimonas yonginensis]|uniref:Glycosyltransferase family 39 protein n=1 Tax=Fulvimonas yonginensis TaxID=1495200 RepID=A0ABU8J8J0_9GAMM